MANLPLTMIGVKGVELVITSPSPGAGISLLLGPQGVSNAAQLWFEAATTNFYDKVRDRFATLDRGTGWTLSGSAVKVPITNPGSIPITAWMRIIGIK